MPQIDAAPDRAGHQVAGQEGQADFGHRHGQRVELEVLGDQEQDAGDQRDHGAEHRRDGHRDVEEDDLEDRALRRFRRKASDQCRCRAPAESRASAPKT